MTTKTATAAVPETETIVHLSPADIFVPKDSNVRFSIPTFKVRNLADKILAKGYVATPIEVEEIPADKRAECEGKHYQLTTGHTRRLAVELLHREADGDSDILGIKLPARVVPVENKLDRLMHQISENVDREDFSPIDKAKAMQSMLDEGATMQDVMNTFRTNTGKGAKTALTPCSPAYVRLTLKLLKYPKVIQTMIQNGEVPTNAAYEFQKYPETEWKAIADKLVQAKLDRETKEAAADEKEAEKLRKVEEVKTASETVTAELTAAEAAEIAAQEAQRKLVQEEEAAMRLARSTKDAAKRKEAEELYKKAQAATTSARVSAEKAEKAAEALRKKAAAVAEKLAKVTDANKAKANVEKTKVTKPDVQAAAVAAGATNKKGVKAEAPETPKLKAQEILGIVEGIKRPTGLAKTDVVLKAIGMLFEGDMSIGAFLKTVQVAVGDAKPDAKAAAKK